jgi:hypothetical protein
LKSEIGQNPHGSAQCIPGHQCSFAFLYFGLIPLLRNSSIFSFF